MRKPLWIVATVFVLLLACMGQLKVSQYPNTKTAADTDLLLLATPGVTNWNITIADFKTNVVAQGGGNTYYINNSYITNLRVLMFTSSIAYVTGDLYVSNIYSGTIYVTNFYVTNIYASNVYVSNLVAAGITSENTFFDFNYTTNLFVSQTNIVNVTISTNIYVSNIVVTNIVVQSGLWQTNRTITIASNATSKTLDFLSERDWYDVPILMETNLVLSPTNLMAGREIWVFFSAGNCNYDVTITNTAGTAIYWNFNSPTNGNSSFTVTNGYKAELSIVCRTNNILHAVYGQYR